MHRYINSIDDLYRCFLRTILQVFHLSPGIKDAVQHKLTSDISQSIQYNDDEIQPLSPPGLCGPELRLR